MKIPSVTMYRYLQIRTYRGNHVWTPTKKAKGRWYSERIARLLERAARLIIDPTAAIGSSVWWSDVNKLESDWRKATEGKR